MLTQLIISLPKFKNRALTGLEGFPELLMDLGFNILEASLGGLTNEEIPKETQVKSLDQI